MENKIMKISKNEIDVALSDTTRQYLIGMLSRPQVLTYIEDEKIEIGITSYSDHSFEKPHTHKTSYEYQYVLSGYTVYLDIDSGHEYEFKEGDFYRISPGFRYAQKSKPNTKILFIKSPSGNDKINIDCSDKVEKWIESKIKTVRKDYTNVENAPKPNSIKPAAAIAITNDSNEILLLKRKDSGNWTMPGGTHEFGESLKECAIREFKEETGLEIIVTDIIGTYSNPNTVIEYSDGEVRQEFTIVFKGQIVSGDIKLDHESTDYKWINVNEISQLQLAESQRIRLNDVQIFINYGKSFIK